jgi:TonB-linked SusC/RagA family outer membrane protein
MNKITFNFGMPDLRLPHNLLLIMRLTTFILILSLSQVSAAGFAQKLTYSKKGASLSEIFSQIEKQTGYHVFYPDEVIKVTGKINVDYKNTNLTVVMDHLSRERGIAYKIDEKNVIVNLRISLPSDYISNIVAAIDIRGRIVDEQGRPLPGANILVMKGETTLTGGTTNAMGEFSIRGVDEQARISISYIGYKTQILNAARDMGTITLLPGEETLRTVSIVNTGYQTLSKDRSAGSFGKPDMKVVADRTTSPDLLQRLEGQVPGLVINNSNGGAGVLVRGLTSVNIASNPLYVVDGIPIADFSTVNPEDVADVSVLKDATAASIWGARAANGVIVVTTKRGQRNNRVNVTYRGYVNLLGKPDLGYQPFLNSREYIQVARELFNLSGYQTTYPYATVTNLSAGGLAPHDVLLYNQAGLNEAQRNAALENLANSDNREHILDTWYRNAATMNHTFSAQGGSERYSFYTSGAYTNTMSNTIGEKNRTYQLTLNQDLKINNFIDLSLLSNVNYNVTNGKNPLPIDYRFLPYQSFTDQAGNGLSLPWMAYPSSYSEVTRLDYQTRSRINLDYNPVNEIERGTRNGNNLITRNQLITRVKLIKGLKFEGTYGFTRAANRSGYFEDQTNYIVRNEVMRTTSIPTVGAAPVYNLPAVGGRLSSANGFTQNWTIRNVLNYDNRWKDGLHQLTLLAGQEAQEQKTKSYSSLVRGWDRQLLRTSANIDWARLSTTGVQNGLVGNTQLFDNTYREDPQVITRFTSYFGNMAYTFDRKYSLNASIRTDQSNLFGIDKSAQNKPAWSVGARWALSDEGFMDQLSWLPTLAMRLTYGIGGNSPGPGTAASDDVLTSIASNFAAGQPSLQISTPANRMLTWERTATTNLGLDFEILNNRINGSIDVYHRVTSDMLGDIETNILTGVNTIYGNTGKLDNKGIELNLNTLNVISPSFRWTTNFNFAYNKNKIISLNPAQAISSASGRIGQQFAAGYDAYAMWAYDFVGLDNLGDPQIKKADGSVIKATSGPTVPVVNDVLFMGTQQPKWSGGFGNTVTYRQFTLSAQAIFNFGHVMRNDVNTFYSGRLYDRTPLLGNIHPDFLLRWQQPGDEAKTNVPSYVIATAVNDSRRSISYYTQGDINVLNASYIKMRDISLQYSLPASLIKKLNVQQVSFRSNVNNILLWTSNDEGIDPDYGGGINRPRRPGQATISFGLDVRF